MTVEQAAQQLARYHECARRGGRDWKVLALTPSNMRHLGEEEILREGAPWYFAKASDALRDALRLAAKRRVVADVIAVVDAIDVVKEKARAWTVDVDFSWSASVTKAWREVLAAAEGDPMGQMTIGLMLGCEVPKGMDLHGEEGEKPDYKGVIGRWEDKVKRRYGDGKPHLTSNYDEDGTHHLLGIFVAVGASGTDGAAHFEAAFPVAEIGEHFKKKITAARKLWDQFAAHVAAKEGVVLPEPRLWITPTEVA